MWDKNGGKAVENKSGSQCLFKRAAHSLERRLLAGPFLKSDCALIYKHSQAIDANCASLLCHFQKRSFGRIWYHITDYHIFFQAFFSHGGNVVYIREKADGCRLNNNIGIPRNVEITTPKMKISFDVRIFVKIFGERFSSFAGSVHNKYMSRAGKG